MSVKDTILPFEMAILDGADFTGAYQPINAPLGLPQACCYMKISNDSTVDIMISYDGVTNHEWIETGGRSEQYFQISNRPGNDVSMVTKGQIIYLIGTAQSAGSVYLMGYYRPQS